MPQGPRREDKPRALGEKQPVDGWLQPIQRGNGIKDPGCMVSHVVQSGKGGAGFQPLTHLPGYLVKDSQIQAVTVQQGVSESSQAVEQANQQGGDDPEQLGGADFKRTVTRFVIDVMGKTNPAESCWLSLTGW